MQAVQQSAEAAGYSLTCELSAGTHCGQCGTYAAPGVSLWREIYLRGSGLLLCRTCAVSSLRFHLFSLVQLRATGYVPRPERG